MHFSTISLLALVPTIAAHGFIYSAQGNADKTKGWALGYHSNTAKNGGGQLPFQRDVAVFKNPAVPCLKGPWRSKCEKRSPLNSGCGLSLFYIDQFHQKYNPQKDKPWKNSAKKKNWWYFMEKYTDERAFIPIKEESEKIVKAGALPKCTAGGWLSMMVHQVNQDGAGPFRCRIDYSGTGKKWTKWIAVSKNVPGSKKSYSVYKKGSLKNWPLNVKIPVDAKCTGTYYGQKNICMVRCENYAINGPFGGCVPFQLVEGKPRQPVVRVKTVNSVKTQITYVTKTEKQPGGEVTVTVVTTQTTVSTAVPVTVTTTAGDDEPAPTSTAGPQDPAPTNETDPDDNGDKNTDDNVEEEVEVKDDDSSLPSDDDGYGTPDMDPQDAAANVAEDPVN
ncbi:hypothetical protein H072_3525 [Dactylellina haptotyla CBS 200.50]|uniref:Uncharacterized protein n=1 Tax=Dactylellina haptotyla (strain CBS 200.50) TaxID=1284197 RepID=S8AHZ4_DACHA|nr:hypothetical protein H072_3525 [Dactylellina haptotyla CBS 200.50]